MKVEQRKATHVVVCEVATRSDATALAQLVEGLCVTVTISHHYNVSIKVHPSEWRTTRVLREQCVPGRLYSYNEISDILVANGFKRGSASGVCSKLYDVDILERPKRGFYRFPTSTAATASQSQDDGPSLHTPST